MPDQQIEYNGKIHQFPDSFSDKDIQDALATEEHPGFLGPKIESSGSFLKDLFLSPVKGLQDIQSGAHNVTQPGSRMKGAHELLSGAGRVATPFALPISAVGAPVATAGALALGALGSTGASKVTEMVGGGEDAQNLAGDIGGIAGGAGGAKLGDIPSVGSVVKGAVKGMWDNATAPSTFRYHGFGTELPIPKILTETLPPAFLGRMLYGEEGATVGAGLGAAHTLYKGAVEGGKAGLRDYRDATIPKTSYNVPPVTPPSPQEFSSIPGQLPSGRAPGKVTPPASVNVGKTVEQFSKPAPVAQPTSEPFKSATPPEMSDAELASSSSARDAIAQKLSKSFHANHITEDQINGMSPTEQEHFWKTWGRTHQEGYNPSELTRERTLKQLNMLESKKALGQP